MSDFSISVNYDFEPVGAVQLDFEIEGEPILFGLWDAEVRFRASALKPLGPWTECCVHEENGCDYLELDMPLEKGFRLQRCFLLDNVDRVLLLADTVLWYDEPDTGKRRRLGEEELSYRSSIHHSAKGTPVPLPESTELLFRLGGARRGRPLFQVFPLALPEWKSSRQVGSIQGTLESEDSTLLLHQRTGARSMYAPLFFDLDPKRLKKQYTWRHLTIGENMERVPDDKAVGYRVALGRDQFLLYRSLTHPANRTVLGHNLIDDFCFARFAPETGVDALVQVQQEFE